MGSGAEYEGVRRVKPSHESKALRAFILISVIMLSSSAFSMSALDVKDVGRDVEHRAHSAMIDVNNMTLVATPAYAYVGDNITFYANASSDIPGVNLTFTIFYDYFFTNFSINPESAVTVNTTTNPGRVVQRNSYSQPGNWTGAHPYYMVMLFVSDGTDNQSIFIQEYVSIRPPNTPPRFLQYPACPVGARANESQSLYAKIADNDSDTVTMYWDFGDGTNAINVTVATPSGVYINQTHTWNPRIPGMGHYNATYYLNVSITDGLHPPVNYSSIAEIHVISNNFPPEAHVSVLNGTVSDHELVSFTANASDPEGDPLTWTFNYTDGSPLEVFHTGYTAPGLLVWMNQTHSFATPGSYPVELSVSDALVPNQIGYHNVSTIVLIKVVANSAPTLAAIIMYPGSPVINETIGYIDVIFQAQAFDPDGDVITVTWNFSGVGTMTNVSTGGSNRFTFIQVVRYTDTGNYSVTVTATDGRVGHLVERSMLANISSDDRAPVLLLFDKANTTERNFVLPNENVTITIIMTDREHDPLSAIVSFGDGSANLTFTNMTNYTNGNITLVLTHSYAKKGNYVVSLIMTDNKVGGPVNHTKEYVLPILVDVPAPVIHHYWDWWDFTSLGMFMMVPVLLIAWTLENRRHRRQIEDQGMTYDEWKILKETDSKELNR